MCHYSCATKESIPCNQRDCITSANQSTTTHQNRTDRVRILSLFMLRNGDVHLRIGRNADTWCWIYAICRACIYTACWKSDNRHNHFYPANAQTCEQIRERENHPRTMLCSRRVCKPTRTVRCQIQPSNRVRICVWEMNKCKYKQNKEEEEEERLSVWLSTPCKWFHWMHIGTQKMQNKHFLAAPNAINICLRILNLRTSSCVHSYLLPSWPFQDLGHFTGSSTSQESSGMHH